MGLTNFPEWIDTGFAICKAGNLSVLEVNSTLLRWLPSVRAGDLLSRHLPELQSHEIEQQIQGQGKYTLDLKVQIVGSESSLLLGLVCQAVSWDGEPAWGFSFTNLSFFEEFRNQSKESAEKTEAESVVKANRTLTAILEGMDQAFFSFNSNGDCTALTPRSCEKLLGFLPTGLKLWDVLQAPDDAASERIRMWVRFIFEGLYDFDELQGLGPKEFAGMPGRYIRLSYRRALDPQSGSLEFMVVGVTDETDTIQAKRQADFERAYSQSILQVVRSRSRFLELIRESKVTFERVREELITPQPRWPVIGRLMHTFKGSISYFSLVELTGLTHQFETLLGREAKLPLPDVHLLLDRLAHIETLFQQFIRDHEDLIGTHAELKGRSLPIPLQELFVFEQKLVQARVPLELARDFREHFTYEPIGPHFAFFDQVLALEASREDKEVHPLEIVNGNLRVRIEAIQELLASLVHIFRNAVAHGIETPPERHDSGKDAAGKVRVLFERLPDSKMLIQISDDGRGIDPQAVRVALKKRSLGVFDHEPDSMVLQRVFTPGLSTSETVTEVAGRGVGLDAVAAAVSKLMGTVLVESETGRGTTFRIEIPEPR